ncbi:hypothetical protein VTN02DRAFT_2252 [Thermoascus thermophilus]
MASASRREASELLDPSTPEALLDLAAEAQAKISETTSPASLVLDRSILDRLDYHLRRDPPPLPSLTHSSRRQLDSAGTVLWNACTRLMRQADGREIVEKTQRLVCRVMIFAFLLLESSTANDKDRTSDILRVLKVALKAARLCLDTNQLNLSLKVLESAATRLECLERLCRSTDEDLIQALSAEYYMLRVMLSCRQGKLDVSEYLFSKIPRSAVKKDPKLAEQLADLCYDVGNRTLSNRKADLAIIWLERAAEADIVSSQRLEEPNTNGNDMRLVILHALVRANLELNTEESWSNITRLLEELNRDFGDRLPVLVLQLEVTSKQANPDYQNFYNILETIIRMLDLTSDNIKLALHYIQMLKDWSVRLSAEALKQLLQRLASTNDNESVERGFVTLIWMLTTSSSNEQGSLDILNDTVAMLADCWSGPLSTAATHASLILLWKKIGAEFSQNNLSIAEEWCRFAQDPIFQQSGLNNIAKIQSLGYTPGHGVHLPALLRCAARLLALELRDSEANNPELKEQLCKIFETAVMQASKHQGSSDGKPFSVSELEWFSRNSYNLALQSCTSWHPGLVTRLLDTSIKLTDLYSQDLASEEQSDACQRRLLCDFLGAVIMVALARKQKDPPVKTEQYLDVRIYAESFRGLIHSQLNRSDGTKKNTWMKKYRAMISFDFEAAVQLKQWDSIGTLVEEARTIADDKLYAIFADVVLSSDMPIEEATRAFEQIIHSLRNSCSPSLSSAIREQLPRYLRCLFQLASASTGAEPSTSTTGTAVAESVLDQAYVLARDLRHSRIQQPPYPDEELEWLAMVAFNQALDFYLASADEDCRRWGRKAIELADLMQGDRGAVGRLLRGKFESLWREG